MNKIKVVIKNPNQFPEIKEIENDLESFKKIVGGHIEAIPDFPPPFCAYCNEEGKLLNLDPNIVSFYTEAEIICGPIIVSKIDSEGEQISLTESEAIEWDCKLKLMSFLLSFYFMH